jgi:hypothetical protein
MMTVQFEFVLSEEFKYSLNGEFVVAKKLLLSAPSSKQIRQAARLEQFYKRALNEQQEVILRIGMGVLENLQKEAKKHHKDSKDNAASNLKENARQILETLQSASKVNFEEVLEAFTDLLVSGVCLIDGKTEFQLVHKNYLSYSELKKILSEYIANFFS